MIPISSIQPTFPQQTYIQYIGGPGLLPEAKSLVGQQCLRPKPCRLLAAVKRSATPRVSIHNLHQFHVYLPVGFGRCHDRSLCRIYRFKPAGSHLKRRAQSIRHRFERRRESAVGSSCPPAFCRPRQSPKLAPQPQHIDGQQQHLTSVSTQETLLLVQF
jgi:hypothetical protein